jgi:hypothetical protein
VRDDDEIIEAYEEDLARDLAPARSNRGFWLVAGTIVVAGVFLVAEILANRPLKDTIGHAQQSLRTAQAAATSIQGRTGSFTSADAAGMQQQEDPSITYLGAEEPSRGLDDVSVAVGATDWAAAVEVRPGACFYVRLTAEGETFYGVGTVCTGTEALAASDPRW